MSTLTSYLAGQEAYDLYKQGREAWNNWADKHVGWWVDFGGWDFSNEESLNFELFRFPGGASFAKATFGDGSVDFGGANFGNGGVNFSEATFGKGDVNFSWAIFGDDLVNFENTNFGYGGVDFEKATFGDGGVNFKKANFFGDNTSFRGASFAGITVFDDATFSRVPNFQQTHFGRDISMERMSVAYKQEATGRFLKRAARSEDASCFRRLRRMAAEAKDHTRELVFFAQETRARYGHDLKKAHQYFPFLLYHWFSNFGRSLWRPALGLVAFCILAAEGLYHYSRYCGLSGSRCDAYMLSLSNAMPFLSWGQSVRPDYLTALYGETISQHLTVSVIMYSQGFFSLIFIFLIGLALRNKLRL